MNSLTKQQTAIRELLQLFINNITSEQVIIGLTLTINRKIALTTGERHLKRFNQFINKKLNGRNWMNRQDNEVSFIAVPEKWKSNPHYHLLVKLQKKQLIKFLKNFKDCWNKQVKSGTVDFTTCDGWINYMTKEWTSLDNYVISTQFRSK